MEILGQAKMATRACDLSTWEVAAERLEVQDCLWIYCEFKASLGHMIPFLWGCLERECGYEYARTVERA